MPVLEVIKGSILDILSTSLQFFSCHRCKLNTNHEAIMSSTNMCTDCGWTLTMTVLAYFMHWVTGLTMRTSKTTPESEIIDINY